MDGNIIPPIPPTPGYRWIPMFAGFTEFTASIPKMYWDVKSQEQRIHALCTMLDKLICYADMLGDQTNLNIDEIRAIQAEFEEFKEHGFEDYYEAQVAAWIAANLEYIYDHTIKQIYFGLGGQDDAYLVAYIPDSWDDITFDTIMNYSSPNYGALTLSY